jgi:hypothetical protein
MSKYILKSDILNSKEVKDYIFENYIEKGKCNQNIDNKKDNKKNPINDNKINYKKNKSSGETYNYNINDFKKNNNKMSSDIMGMYAGDNLYAAV